MSMSRSIETVLGSKVCRVKNLPLFGVDVVIFAKRENWSTAMDSLHWNIKCLIYHGTEDQHLHTWEYLKFQYVGQYGR